MAFLDNSGDIILDAVLTDLGRKRMAQGNFKITQFALGDDEIDYRIYNKNHPSGSAYYDLEILQTPVLEAFASSNANINYGLVSFAGNLNLLYLPSIKKWGNPKSVQVADGKQILRTSGSVYYIAANDDTSTALKSIFDTQRGEGNGQLYYSYEDNKNCILIETGIDSPGGNPPRTADLTNESDLIIANGLADANFDIHVDNRFVSKVYGADTIVWNIATNGTVTTAIQSVNPRDPSINSDLGSNMSKAQVNGHRTKVRATDDGTTAASFSAINGPSGQMLAITFRAHSNIRDSSADYASYGKTGQDLFGDGNTYDYIDTTVYVVGKSSGVTTHVPVRIAKKVV
jgi:hypothetical protein